MEWFYSVIQNTVISCNQEDMDVRWSYKEWLPNLFLHNSVYLHSQPRFGRFSVLVESTIGLNKRTQCTPLWFSSIIRKEQCSTEQQERRSCNLLYIAIRLLDRMRIFSWFWIFIEYCQNKIECGVTFCILSRVRNKKPRSFLNLVPFSLLPRDVAPSLDRLLLRLRPRPF